jgi:hypothetical protein
MAVNQPRDSRGRFTHTYAVRKNAFDFQRDLEAFAKQIDRDLTTVVRTTAFLLFTKIVDRTPVRSGRAVGSWAISIGRPGTDMIPKGGRGSKAVAMARLNAVDFSRRNVQYFIYNNVEYIGRLEYGYSKQAPQGMVRLALAETEAELDSVLTRLS